MFKNGLVGLIGVALLLGGCAQKNERNLEERKQNRFVVKLVERGDTFRLGADGLSDDDFDQYVKGQSLIPGDVIVLETFDDLSTIKVIFEKKDLSSTYIAGVKKINIPDGPEEHSKYSYKIVFRDEWHYASKNHQGLPNEYLLKQDVYGACIINEDSSTIMVSDIPDGNEFYCVFDSSDIEEYESFDIMRYCVHSAMYLSYLPSEIERFCL